MNSSTQQQSNMWFAISLGLMGIIVGYALASIPTSGTNSEPQKQVAASSRPAAPTPPAVPTVAKDVPPVDAKTDYVRGNPNAKLTLITYSDYECPFSKRHHATLAQITAAYKDDVNLVYRHYPLNFHANAQKEAEAAECVGELGGNEAFWKFTDGIYEKTTSNGTGFALADLQPLAKQVGVDEAKFKTCFESGKFTKKVQDEMAGGQKAGVTGTPGNILIDNKTKVASTIPGGAKPFDAFKAVIDAALAAK